MSRSEDHEDRLRRLERALWAATGAAAIIGGTVSGGLFRMFGG